jgi:pre-mRNA-splicing factor CDC5/CEF1
LKAAVSKYGFNQWAKVASLLARKTAKQAKARWNEFLDPRINKDEWSQQEDTKLLDLARLIPNQWRTIASRLGRTATQCIERYQRLLDDEGSSDLSLAGPGIETLESVGASHDLQLGDINVNPETKQARPDAVDLDEDEKEMLSEARARLANTKGKKATRKAREKMLEESRRVSLLQKRRDLKQAGVTTSLKAPKKKFATQIDFNADIPFEHSPGSGFYDTTEEAKANQQTLSNFSYKVNKSGLKDDDEKKKKTKRHREEKTESHAQQIGGRLPEEFNKKPKLDLPEPVFKEDQLLDLIREGTDVDMVAKGLEEGRTKDIDTSLKEKARRIKESKVEKSVLLTTGEDEVKEPSDETETRDLTASPENTEPKLKIHTLSERLATLPKPQNEFELIEEVSESEQEEVKSTSNNTDSIAEDVGERMRLKKLHEEKELEKALLRRSQAVQRSLKIPDIPAAITLKPLADSAISKMIDEELVKLIRSDYSKIHKVSGVPLLADLDEKSKARIDQEISAEINEKERLKLESSFLEKAKTLTSGTKLTVSSELQDFLINALSSLVTITGKSERELEEAAAKHIATNDDLNEKYLTFLSELRDADRTLIAFKQLYTKERIDFDERLASLRNEVDILVQAEHSTQEHYLQLKRAHNGNS